MLQIHLSEILLTVLLNSLKYSKILQFNLDSSDGLDHLHQMCLNFQKLFFFRIFLWNRNFSRKMHENEEILEKGRAQVLAPPPSLGSTNESVFIKSISYEPC